MLLFDLMLWTKVIQSSLETDRYTHSSWRKEIGHAKISFRIFIGLSLQILDLPLHNNLSVFHYFIHWLLAFNLFPPPLSLSFMLILSLLTSLFHILTLSTSLSFLSDFSIKLSFFLMSSYFPLTSVTHSYILTFFINSSLSLSTSLFFSKVLNFSLYTKFFP